jgi:predicted DNA-binding WGR domain protein
MQTKTKKTATVSTSETPAATSAKDAAPSQPRHFEYVGGSSAKFWEVSQSGCDMTTRWGRIGSAGQSKTKSFPDEAAATKAVERLIAEKTGEGYVEK